MMRDVEEVFNDLFAVRASSQNARAPINVNQLMTHPAHIAQRGTVMLWGALMCDKDTFDAVVLFE